MDIKESCENVFLVLSTCNYNRPHTSHTTNYLVNYSTNFTGLGDYGQDLIDFFCSINYGCAFTLILHFHCNRVKFYFSNCYKKRAKTHCYYTLVNLIQFVKLFIILSTMCWMSKPFINNMKWKKRKMTSILWVLRH